MKLTIDHSKVSHERLGSEPVDKLLFKMALPSVIAMIMQALYNSVDSMFVAKISSESLAAVTLAFPVTMIIGAMSTGIGACKMKIKGIVMHGRHNNNRIRRIVDICMTVSLLFLMAYQVTGDDCEDEDRWENQNGFCRALLLYCRHWTIPLPAKRMV